MCVFLKTSIFILFRNFTINKVIAKQIFLLCVCFYIVNLMLLCNGLVFKGRGTAVVSEVVLGKVVSFLPLVRLLKILPKNAPNPEPLYCGAQSKTLPSMFGRHLGKLLVCFFRVESSERERVVTVIHVCCI